MRVSAWDFWGRRCGKERPAEEGGGEPKGRRQGGAFLPSKHNLGIQSRYFWTVE